MQLRYKALRLILVHARKQDQVREAEDCESQKRHPQSKRTRLKIWITAEKAI
jgi:hypothetical protein